MSLLDVELQCSNTPAQTGDKTAQESALTWHNTMEIGWYSIKDIGWYTMMEIHWYTMVEIRQLTLLTPICLLFTPPFKTISYQLY